MPAVAGMPLSDAVESIQTFSASEEVVIPDYPPMQQDLQRVPAHITRFENDRDRYSFPTIFAGGAFCVSKLGYSS